MCTDDTYYIPRVTDCTRDLNEWVYEGDQDRLINTPPRELPELVWRFTQDIYMCVYVQPDVAMYGDADEEEDYLSPVREPYSIVSESKCSVYAECTINTCIYNYRCCSNSVQTKGEQGWHCGGT